MDVCRVPDDTSPGLFAYSEASGEQDLTRRGSVSDLHRAKALLVLISALAQFIDAAPSSLLLSKRQDDDDDDSASSNDGNCGPSGAAANAPPDVEGLTAADWMRWFEDPKCNPVPPKDKALFWSGKLDQGHHNDYKYGQVAAEFARSKDLWTLEALLHHQGCFPAYKKGNPFSDILWPYLSGKFAKNAKGKISILLGETFWGSSDPKNKDASVWNVYEKAYLLGKCETATYKQYGCDYNPYRQGNMVEPPNQETKDACTVALYQFGAINPTTKKVGTPKAGGECHLNIVDQAFQCPHGKKVVSTETSEQALARDIDGATEMAKANPRPNSGSSKAASGGGGGGGGSISSHHASSGSHGSSGSSGGSSGEGGGGITRKNAGKIAKPSSDDD